MRLPRYSLRLLFTAMIAAAVLCALVGRRIAHNNEARRIIAAHGCRPRLDHTGWWASAELWLAQRLPHNLSSRFSPTFADCMVRFNGQNTSVQLHDRDLEELSRLEHLVVLDVGPENVDPNDPITDAGVKHLGRCRELGNVCICSDRVTDKSLEVLSRLEGIRELTICSAAITDAGVRHLTRLPALRWLGLGTWPPGPDRPAANITDAAIERIGQIKTLTGVGVRGTRITDDGAKRLRAMLPGAHIAWPDMPLAPWSY